jgi:sigma-B regulation protein RsbU (phosphoserine phosphatase)
MRLSTRIALFVSIAFLLAFGALVVIGAQREILASQPLNRIAISGQEALWQQILLAEAARLTDLEERIAADPEIVAAIAAGDLPALRKLVLGWTQPRLPSGGLADLQIIDRQGQVLLASSNLAEPPRLIDISTIAGILDGARPQGIR